jgi:uncharacterized glyoxalase superfamily protein PhnB
MASPALYPNLLYADPDAALDWLERVLGFERREEHRDEGADVAPELTDTDYGSRDFTVRDPEGNLWALGTYRP